LPISLSCLVTSSPGAGLEHLCRALETTGAMGASQDYFNPQDVVSRCDDWGVHGSEADFMHRYVQAVRAAATAPTGVCSVSALWSHQRWMVRALRVGWADSGGVGQSDADVVAAFFPHLAYIHLSCEDKARQALRWYAEMHPGSDSRAVPDYQEVRWRETLIERHERSWRAYFRVHALAAAFTRYEDLREHPAQTLQPILVSLGLNAAVGDLRPPRSHLDETVDAWHGPYSESRIRLSSKVGDRGRRT
jgi:LPS sulfotransferase NodH